LPEDTQDDIKIKNEIANNVKKFWVKFSVKQIFEIKIVGILNGNDIITPMKLISAHKLTREAKLKINDKVRDKAKKTNSNKRKLGLASLLKYK